MTEREKMLAGELYAPSDPDLVKRHDRARMLFAKYNKTSCKQEKKRDKLIKQLFGKTGENIKVETPFFCDYGENIEVGENFYANNIGRKQGKNRQKLYACAQRGNIFGNPPRAGGGAV